jgi:hypothetical protein
VPDGNDYVIIDRCAGTGNLEEYLTEEELKHCVLSTYEYYEYKVLLARLGSRVKLIIPPTEKDAEYRDEKIKNADALSENYINNDYLQELIKNPKMTIIMLENPPYHDITTVSCEDNKQGNTFVSEEMKKRPIKVGKEVNDIANQFIWSAFKYYLRQPTDSYIVFSPVKYFKSLQLANKKFRNGFLLNRKHFHATKSSISLIHWQNIDEIQEDFLLKTYDIELNKTVAEEQEQINQGKIKYIKDILIKKVYAMLSKYYDKRKFDEDIETNVCCESNGYEGLNRQVNSFYNSNIIGYLITKSFLIEGKNVRLSRQMYWDKHGFYLRSNNYIEKLPLFCAKSYPQDEWYEKDVYFTTADKGFEYVKDKEFLKNCFIYTCLSQRNKCISFTGNDGRFYKNELCFDDGTLATEHLKTLKLNEKDRELVDLWQEVFEECRKTKNYKPDLRYGTYQIIQELNTSYKNDKNKTIYDYPMLNTKIEALKNALKSYYKTQIQDKLFEYELLK